MKNYHPCQPEIITPNEMRLGWEGHTTIDQVHPTSGTLSFDAPIFRDRTPLTVVTVSKDRHGQFHIWGDSTWIYPRPELTGIAAEFHLQPWAGIIDITDIVPVDELDPMWGEPS